MLKSIVLPGVALALVAFHGCSSGGGSRVDAGSGGAQAGSGGGNTPDPGSGGTAGVGGGGSGGSGGANGGGGGSGGGGGGDAGSGGASGKDGGGAGAPGSDGGADGARDAATELPPANCPALANSWDGDYDITRLIVRELDGVDRPPRTRALSRAGIRDQNGDVWAIVRDSFVTLMADGGISAIHHMSQNGTYAGYREGSGRWMAEGASTLSVDWSGDSYYRRKFAVGVQGCVLKLVKTFPADFENSSYGREYIEVDLLRR